LDVAKDVWTTLQMAHEGSKTMRKAKVKMLEGQLKRFIMYDDETTYEMFNRLKKLINKARALWSKKWTDRMLTEILMMAYTPMNYNVVVLICQDPANKKMTSDDVLGRIMNHEMNIQEANNIKNLYKGVSTYKKQDIALKANKSKKKKVLIESPSEEEEEEEEDSEREDDNDEMALFIKKFNKLIKKRRPYKGGRKEKPRSRECATIMVRMGTSLPNAHMRGRKKTITRERSLTEATRKIRNTLRRSLMVKPMLAKNGTQVMRVPNRKVMR
jgi:hypothetical protein